MAKDFSEQWPAYPPGYEKPLPLVDVRVKLSVDKLFGLLYAAGSPFVVSLCATPFHSHQPVAFCCPPAIPYGSCSICLPPLVQSWANCSAMNGLPAVQFR